MTAVITTAEIITAADIYTTDDYTTEPNRRHLEHLGGWVEVNQIRLTHNTELVGYILINDGFVFGAAECHDGSLRVVDECLPDGDDNRHAVIAAVIGVWADVSY